MIRMHNIYPCLVMNSYSVSDNKADENSAFIVKIQGKISCFLNRSVTLVVLYLISSCSPSGIKVMAFQPKVEK